MDTRCSCILGSSYHIQLLENDEIISDSKEIANSINKHSNHPSIKPIHKHPEHHINLSFKQLNPSEVGTILGKLNTKTATGCDGLTNPLSGIINHVFDLSKFPTHAKAAEVDPIHKRIVSWTRTTIDL